MHFFKYKTLEIPRRANEAESNFNSKVITLPTIFPSENSLYPTIVLNILYGCYGFCMVAKHKNLSKRYLCALYIIYTVQSVEIIQTIYTMV